MRARRMMLFQIEGRHDLSYLKLANYIEMVKKTNLGSHDYITWDSLQPANEQTENDDSVPPKLRFKRCFISLKGVIDEFLKGCRHIIRLDGTHLKGPYKGVLLTTMRLDTENHSYPLARAIVEFENDDSWGYFFNCFVANSGRRTPWQVDSIIRQMQGNNSLTFFLLHLLQLYYFGS